MKNTKSPPHSRKSIASTVLEIIHAKKLWRYYGKEGIEEVNRELGTGNKKIGLRYFAWIKSRYLVQRMLKLPVNRLIKLNAEDRQRLAVLRTKIKSQNWLV